MDELPDPAPVQYVATAVGDIAVRRTPVRGPGPHEPAVLVHGLGGNALNWVDLADALSDRLDCVAMDLPGFGYTPPPIDDDFSIGAQARAVVAVIEAVFPGQRVHLFAESFGGAVALRVAATRGDLLRSLCLISPALPTLALRSGNVQMPIMAIPRLGEYLVSRYLRIGADQRIAATYEVVFRDSSRLPAKRRAEAVAETKRRDALPWVTRTYVRSVRGLLSTFADRSPDAPWRLAARVEVPVLLLYGRWDRLVDARAVHRAMRSFRNARVVVLPEGAHMAQVEHPGEVARAWREWMG